MRRAVYLSGRYQRDYAKRLIDEAPDGYIMDIRERTRTDEQNKILHALIDDIRAQVPGADEWTKEEWKLRFLHALRNETRFLPELDGNGVFPIGQRTSALGKSQFSALLEIVFEWGARNGVIWSDQSARAA
jgi:hypothetical protein